MKRAFLFLAVFVVVALATYALVIIPNYSAFKTLYANNDGMRDGYEYIESTYSLKTLTEFIGEKPEFFSIVSYNVNDPDSGIFYNPDELSTLGSMGNIFLLIEYERQIAEGLLDPNALVNLQEIEKYLLPQINQNAHEGAMEYLTAEEVPVTNDNAMRAMLEYNSLALSDYFWFKLGEENLRNLMADLNLKHTEMPVPFSGYYSVIAPHVSPTVSADARENLDYFSAMHRDSMFAEMIETAYTFINDEQQNALRKQFIEDERLSMSFIEERDALELLPHTTAREITGLLAELINNEIISEEVSEAVKNKLRWPMDSEPIKRSFSDYGAIYDNRMGMLSGIDFGTSIYDGHTSVQAVFFDDLPVAFFIHLSSNHMQEDYQQRLIWDPALYETTIKQIEKNN
ncbi:MAG: serine hydrolase [Balneolaceae bacterium]|nr:serine hydrolase [Balneolaceae bacterium]